MSIEQEQFLSACKKLWDNYRQFSSGTDGAARDVASIDVYGRLISSANELVTIVEDIKRLNVIDKLGNEISYSLTKNRYKTKETVSPALSFNIHFGEGVGIGIQVSKDGHIEFIYDGSTYQNVDQDMLKLKEFIFKRIAAEVTPDLLNPSLKDLLLS